MLLELTDLSDKYRGLGLAPEQRIKVLLQFVSMLAVTADCPSDATFGELAKRVFFDVRARLAAACQD
jgi:hypothetical protein